MIITPSQAAEDNVSKTSAPPPFYSQATAPSIVETTSHHHHGAHEHHDNYGPGPLGNVLPYYDPNSEWAMREGARRARRRFLGAVFWAIVIWIAVGALLAGGRTDEDLINKSLLDSINADVDTTSTSSTRLSPASQHSHLSYDHQQVSSSSLPIYTSRNSLDIMSPSSTNPSNPAATNSPYSHFPQQPYTHHHQYRQDALSYPTKADIFGPSPNDPLVRYDFDAYQDAPLAPKQTTSYSAQLLKQQQQQQQQQQQSQPQQPQPTTQQPFVTNGLTVNGGVPYLNGLQNGITFSHPHPHLPHHHHHAAQHSLLHAPGPASNPSQQPSSQQISAQSSQTQNSRNDQSQEEISTIFVVGFPDDMQEREFQNMFTFSNGFEAATLKIPNKDLSAYGSAAGASGATSTLRQAGYINQQHGSSAYSGAQDPYNLVTVNSGGVVVDGPQGTSSSWQQSNPADSFGIDIQQQPQQIHPPQRKQIIGFAKFRTRQEALEARDVLQGRRVDIEKGAILKAEMAKKNLHTKRGVGPLGLPVGLIPSAPTSNVNLNPSGPGVSGIPNNHALVSSSEMSGVVNTSSFSYSNGPLMGLVSPSAPASAVEPLTARDRQLGTLDAMGLGANSLTRRQQQQDEEREHEQRDKRTLSVSTATSTTVTRDDQDQEQLRRENDRNLRSTNPTLYDAFHLVSDASGSMSGSSNINGNTSHQTGFPDSSTTFPGFSLHPGNNAVQSHGSLLSLASTLHGTSFPGGNGDAYISPQLRHQHQHQQLLQLPQAHHSTAPGTPWKLTTPNANSLSSSSVPPRPPSSSQSSPPSSFDVPYSVEQKAAYSSSSYIDSNGVLSPPDLNTSLPANGGSQILRTNSPGGESSGQQYYHHSPSSLPRSSSSSVAEGSQGSSLGSLENEFSRTLMVSTEHGMTSPQLPSPGSGDSSTGGPTATSTSTLSSGVDGRQTSSNHPRNHYPGNASDQNPPINTLYVGNLPNSPVSAGYASTVLEDSLRSLFSQCSGYRKLCFRQKNNGPMCFVEFDDVNYATKAMHELYGHQLNGLVKGGIRLSFSKNPLGVRPSNPNGSSQRNGQQQQQLSSGSHQSPITASSTAMNFSSMHDALQTRTASSDVAVGGGRPILRHHDSSLAVGVTELGGSPSHNYSYSMSSPPTSRFFSPPPSTMLSAIGSGPGVGVNAAGGTASSSMSSASSTSSTTSASGASSVSGYPGSSFSSNMRSTAPFSPPLSTQAHSPSFGMIMNVGVPVLETDDRAVRFARSPPISASSQIHSFGASGLTSFSAASSSSDAVSPGLEKPSQ